MSVHLRFILIAAVLQANARSLPAAVAIGWFEEDCSGTTFHVIGAEGIVGGQRLVLQLNTHNFPVVLFLTGAEWFDVHGERCSVDGKCEEVTQARIWLNKREGE